MRVKLATRIGTKYYYSTGFVSDLSCVLNYLSTLKDINQFYELCRASKFESIGSVLLPGNDKSTPRTKRDLFRNIKSTVIIFMDRNIDYNYHSPFVVYRDSTVYSTPGYHSTLYLKKLDYHRKHLDALYEAL